jgi:hypothetical protein
LGHPFFLAYMGSWAQPLSDTDSTQWVMIYDYEAKIQSYGGFR